MKKMLGCGLWMGTGVLTVVGTVDSGVGGVGDLGGGTGIGWFGGGC